MGEKAKPPTSLIKAIMNIYSNKYSQYARSMKNSVPNLGYLTIQWERQSRCFYWQHTLIREAHRRDISHKIMSEGGRSSRKSQRLEKLLRCRRGSRFHQESAPNAVGQSLKDFEEFCLTGQGGCEGVARGWPQSQEEGPFSLLSSWGPWRDSHGIQMNILDILSILTMTFPSVLYRVGNHSFSWEYFSICTRHYKCLPFYFCVFTMLITARLVILKHQGSYPLTIPWVIHWYSYLCISPVKPNLFPTLSVLQIQMSVYLRNNPRDRCTIMRSAADHFLQEDSFKPFTYFLAWVSSYSEKA